MCYRKGGGGFPLPGEFSLIWTQLTRFLLTSRGRGGNGWTNCKTQNSSLDSGKVRKPRSAPGVECPQSPPGVGGISYDDSSWGRCHCYLLGRGVAAACSPAVVFQCVTIQNHLETDALSLFFFVSAHPQVPLSCTEVYTSVVEHQSGGGNGPTSPQGSEWLLRQVGRDTARGCMPTFPWTREILQISKFSE